MSTLVKEIIEDKEYFIDVYIGRLDGYVYRRTKKFNGTYDEAVKISKELEKKLVLEYSEAETETEIRIKSNNSKIKKIIKNSLNRYCENSKCILYPCSRNTCKISKCKAYELYTEIKKGIEAENK